MSELVVDSVSITFGGVRALSDVSFSVAEGEVVGLIGPNGAGKTTTFNAITGAVHPTEGRIVYDGRVISKLAGHRIADLRIVRTFQLVELFDRLTVGEALVVAAHHAGRPSFRHAIFGGRTARARAAAARERRDAVASQLALDRWRDTPCGVLPHGVKKLMSVGLALAAGPRIMLLDEPLAGLTSQEIALMAGVVTDVRRQGIGILLVEHNVGAVMSMCDRVVVLNFGRIIADGDPGSVAAMPEVIAAYLGEDDNEREPSGDHASA